MTKVNGKLLRHVPLLGGEYTLRVWSNKENEIAYEFNHGDEQLFRGSYERRNGDFDSDLAVSAILSALTELPSHLGERCLSRYDARQRHFLEGDAHRLAILNREILIGRRAFPDVEMAVHEAESINVFEVTLEYLADFPGETWFRDQQGKGKLGWYYWSSRWAGSGNSSARGPYTTRGAAYREAYDHFQMGEVKKNE